MAHSVEPMDIDNIESDFDNKENSIHHSNVYPRTPCTEKGYEELDVSELNMKLRYSITPAASPMSRSFTANCTENRSLESSEDTLNANLTRSLHAAFSKGDTFNKSVKTLPLQSISTEQLVDNSRNASVLRQLDSSAAVDSNVTVTITQPNEMDENLSLPSTSSSAIQTPEATTPTKDIPRDEGGSPIMRGLKSVLNMFRSSQSPIPAADHMDVGKQVLSPADGSTPDSSQSTLPVLASTPLAAHKQKDANTSKRCSPHKDSLVFNDDLEKELLWKDETTILFSQEKIPIHKLFFQQTPNAKNNAKNLNVDDDLNSTVEYMDISHNDSVIKNKTITDIQFEGINESDGEFVDCETTFTNDNPEIPILPEDKESVNIEEPNSTQVIDVSTIAEQLHVSVKTELPQSDTTVTLNNQEHNHQVEPVLEPKPSEIDLPAVESSNDNKQEIPVEIAQNEGKPEVSSVITSHDENQGNLSIKPVHESVQVENVMPADTDNTEVISAQIEEIAIVTSNIHEQNANLTVTLPEMNVTIGSGITENSACEKSQFNMTYETRHSLGETVIKPNIVNSTLILSESDVDKANFSNIQDLVSNSTFVQPAEFPNPNTTSKCEDATFVKEEPAEHSAVPAVNNITTDIVVENATFVKEIQDTSLPSDNINTTVTIAPLDENATFVKEVELNIEPSEGSKKSENATFIKGLENESISEHQEVVTKVEETINFKENDIERNKVSNVGYNTFIHEIKNEQEIEEQVNTSTPNAETVIQNSPANIPLPDEDDIEHEKSIGASLLVEEKIISDINNTVVLDNENNVEEMPMKEAKSINVDTGNESLAASNINNEIETDKILDANESTVQQCNQLEVEEFKPNEDLPKLIMDDNEVEAQKMQTTLHDVSMELVYDVDPVEIIPETIVTSDNNASIEMSETFVTEKRQVQVSSDVNNVGTSPDVPSEVKDIQDPVFDKEIGNAMEIIDTNLQVQEVHVKSCIEESKGDILNETAVSAEDVREELNHSICEKIKIDEQSVKDNLLEKTNTDSISKPNENIESVMVNSTVMKTEIGEAVTENRLEVENDENKNISLNKQEDETVILEKNNSPFVLVPERIDDVSTAPLNIDDAQNPFATKSRIVLTPPSSPKIVSKGYNFNFDEIDDPFATKTKIRLSPTPDTSPKVNTTYEELEEPPRREINKNRRKSQPEKKRPIAPKKKLNSTFSGSVKTPKPMDTQKERNIEKESNASLVLDNKDEVLPENKPKDLEFTSQRSPLDTTTTTDINTLPSTGETCLENDVPKEQKTVDERDIDTVIIDENKSSIESIHTVMNETKTTSSSEQSTYYSAGTSSGEATTCKNVFNIPEIDDMSFNPFVTKTKMRQSPPPGIVDTDSEEIEGFTKQVSSIEESGLDTRGVDPIVEKGFANVSNTTCSSKGTDDKDVTIREVHTEDEDTEEGPFMEADDNDKMSDFDGDDVDMMQFSELPPQNIEENADSGEMFIDAEAFEFLLNQNKSNVVSDSGKESLFLKFDPLFAKRVSTDGVLAALNKVQKRQSTPKKMPPRAAVDATFALPGPSTLNVTQEVEHSVTAEESAEDVNVTVSKPMMVVTPAVNPVVTPRNKTTTPTSSNRRSLTFTSPAIAVIDRLLSLSANNSLMGHDTTVTASREQNEADLALTQLRELLAEKEINVYSLRSESKELKDRLSSLESQMRTLESESENRLRKVNELNEKLSEKTKINKSMAAVVEEYERTIASLIAETEQDKKRHNEERMKLIKERDEQTAHLASMEVSFSDLHSKYEKSKQIILTCKANEDSYKKSIKDFEENLSKMQSNYELLKQHATSKLNHANQELEKMNRAHESEILKMNAMIKRKELHITSLEETLAQKTKANEELTAICDELINKVG